MSRVIVPQKYIETLTNVSKITINLSLLQYLKMSKKSL